MFLRLIKSSFVAIIMWTVTLLNLIFYINTVIDLVLQEMKETCHVLWIQVPAIALFCKAVVYQAIDRINMLSVSITTGVPHVILWYQYQHLVPSCSHHLLNPWKPLIYSPFPQYCFFQENYAHGIMTFGTGFFAFSLLLWRFIRLSCVSAIFCFLFLDTIPHF